ncbi:MAG TPA: nucleotide exchange factor GrpE [Verrucomicrobiae bacterium]|nr:nucleotide exchange factor GrpE [Verrucomicrobiae bacterium]
MRDSTAPTLSKWPFFFGDALLGGAAWLIMQESTRPMGLWQVGFVVLCAAGGAVLSILPFLLEYRVGAKLAEGRGLATAVEQLQKLEGLAGQISGATSQWQMVHEEAGKTAATAKGLAERMSAEAKAFTEFMRQANDAERAALRLEVEKLRRAEGDWVQVLVRMLDHVYALNAAGQRSGQPQLIDQLGHFQNACRDAARRVGLTPFLPAPAEPFDNQRHQLAEPNGAVPAGALIAETVASGYTFQGRLLRPALVRIQNGDLAA